MANDKTWLSILRYRCDKRWGAYFSQAKSGIICKKINMLSLDRYLDTVEVTDSNSVGPTKCF